MQKPAWGIIARRFSSYRPVQPGRDWQQWRAWGTTYAAVAACCTGYAYNLYADDQVAKRRNYSHRNFIDKHMVFSRENYNAGRWWTAITHSAMHFNLLHLACNMLALTSFGPLSIMLFGLPSTALMWVGSSLASSWAILKGNEYKSIQAKSGAAAKPIEIFGQRLPRGQPSVEDTVQVIGASSSILGMIASVAFVVPKRPLYIFPLPMAVPMGAAVAGFGLASAMAWSQDLLPMLGHTGHLGGMAFGALYYLAVLRRRVRIPRF